MVVESDVATTNGSQPSNAVDAGNVNVSPNEKSVEPMDMNISTAEDQVEKLPYPKSVFFIISNEFCERFNFYGMRTILVLYLSRQLNYSDDTATIIFHIFTMFVYFLCVFGAIISDSWLGKFKTILYLSLVYVCGSILVTLGAIPTLNLPAITFTMIGLALIALGSGGIKPCVSAFGGDQFKLPEQIKYMATFFSLFYFTINAGSLISTTVTPILREDVHCFGEKECYSLAFGVPAVLMLLSIVFFVLGRPLYNVKPPAGNMVVLVSKTIATAISTKWKEKKTNPRDHWLDYADKKFDRQLIDDVKVLMRVLVLFLPLPVFWALFDQQGSRWTFQATRMDGDMGSWSIKPDQAQMINPLLILIFIPLYVVIFYPALALIGIRRPLQKLTMGGVLAGVAFVISAIVELNLEKTYPVLPAHGLAQLRVFNGEACDYYLNTNITGVTNIPIKSLEMYVNKDIEVPDGYLNFVYTISTNNTDCKPFFSGSHYLAEKTAHSAFIGSQNALMPLKWYLDEVDKPSRGSPLVRNLANVAPNSIITWRAVKKETLEYEGDAYNTDLLELNNEEYNIYVNEQFAYTTRLRVGGVYTFILHELGGQEKGYIGQEIEVTEPNSLSIWWIVPQYVVMTLGEVMFSVTGIEFSYAQAPMSMKSVLQACWYLTVAFGNVIVVIIAELDLFESQANEFFLFAGLMFVDMILFAYMAWRYVPNDPNQQVEGVDSIDPKTEVKPLELSKDNKSFEANE